MDNLTLDALGIDMVCALRARMPSNAAVARACGVPPMVLHCWVRTGHDRWDAWQAACEARATQLEDEAEQVLEAADREMRVERDISSSIVALARERSRLKMRRAAIVSPSTHGEAGPSVNVQVGVSTGPARTLSNAELLRVVQSGGAALHETDPPPPPVTAGLPGLPLLGAPSGRNDTLDQ